MADLFSRKPSGVNGDEFAGVGFRSSIGLVSFLDLYAENIYHWFYALKDTFLTAKKDSSHLLFLQYAVNQK